MYINDQVMDEQERIGFRLRSLYSDHGYSRYKMGKFEEYDLYSQNKDFLLSKSVITFTDTNGRLMALKPDVTLSIVKTGRDLPGQLRKLYYHENVYRVSAAENGFRELTQVGLECTGAVDVRCLAEVLLLAAESLKLCSENFILEVSHLGILSAFAEKITANEAVRNEILRCAGEKNLHGISQICSSHGITGGSEQGLLKLLKCYGEPRQVLPEIRSLAEANGAGAYAEELEQAMDAFTDEEIKQRICIDFSAVGDLKYYNGITFKGFISGIPGAVLSGGQYDTLMRKMGRKDHAVGFAVFLDMLERLNEEKESYA